MVGRDEELELAHVSSLAGARAREGSERGGRRAVAVGRKRRRVTLKARTVDVAPAASKAVTLQLPATLRGLLRRQGKLSLRLQAKVRRHARRRSWRLG